MFASFLAPLSSKIFGALSLALLLALAVQTWRVGRLEGKLDDAREQIAAMESARSAAEDKATLADKRARAKAKEADNANEAANDLRRRADDYARRMRYDQGISRGGPEQGDPAAPGNGPGPDAVILSRPDFDTLNENTIRLQRVHEWGEGLIEAGLAEKSDER